MASAAGEFVDRADGENRLALIHRLLGEAALAQLVRRDHLAQIRHGVGRRGKIVHREDAFDAGHGQRFALVSMLRTWPCGTGLSSSLANSMPSAR